MLPPKKPVSPPKQSRRRTHRVRLDPALSDPQRAEYKQPGVPGYRTQTGHSSLDPIESYAESGHIAGVFLRDLLMLRVRPHSLSGRLALLLAGLAMLAPLVLAIYQSFASQTPDFDMLITAAIPGFLGAYLLGNLGASLARRRTRS